MTIQDDFRFILSNYLQAKNGLVLRSEVDSVFKSIARKIQSLGAVKKRKTLIPNTGIGRTQMANIPWIALFDIRITKTAQKGVYIAYLFKADMSGIYLALTQGVNDGTKTQEELQENADHLRAEMIELRDSGFTLDADMQLMDKGPYGSAYEKVTIAYKFLDKQNIPSDFEIEQDLEALLNTYSRYVNLNTTNQPTLEEIAKTDWPAEEPIQCNPTYTADEFALETGFEKQTIDQWMQILKRKKHLIFQGPPGTGKTFVAQRLAKLMVSETNGFVEIIQFHPDFSYEDFIQGYYPEPQNGILSFKLKPGLFLKFCAKARAKTDDDPCLLIIDEINRANLSRVFGELMYLLEYREQKMPLAAGGEVFKIPKNVFIIGTMNTADRSIALVDHALRRRFSFYRLKPEYEILSKYLDKYNLPVGSLVDVLKEINQTIEDPNYEIGISFFMNDNQHLRKFLGIIWKTEIEPYLEEFFIDQPEEAERFRWENLVKDKLKEWVEHASTIESN